MDHQQFLAAARQTLVRPAHFALPGDLADGVSYLAFGLQDLPIAPDVRGGLYGGLLTWLQHVNQATVNAIPVLPEAAATAPPAAAESLSAEPATPADEGDPRGPIGPLLDAANTETPSGDPRGPIEPSLETAHAASSSGDPSGDPVTALLSTLNRPQ